jgi:hypothetical protein
MNKRIRELAIDCAGQKEWDFPKDPKSYTFTPDELTKFAELIVRECALTAGLMEHEGRPNIGVQILDNFGVES